MNRNERIADNNIVYVPTLAIADHLTSRNGTALDQVFREDVVQSAVANISAYAIDFSNVDRIELDCALLGVNLTINGTDDGDVKYLLVSKTDGATLTFANAQNNVVNPDVLTEGTNFLLQVTNKNSVIYITNITKSFDKATQAEVNAGIDVNKYVTPETLANKTGVVLMQTIDIGAWNMVAVVNNPVDISSLGIDNSKIVSIQAWIVGDVTTTISSDLCSNTDAGQGGNITFIKLVSNTTITLNRVTGGRFDNTGYDDAVINRGTITIFYTL